MSSLRKTLLSNRRGNLKANFTPVKWSTYFQKHDSKVLSKGTFHYYTVGDSGPLLVTIHGGGYSALTWSLFVNEIVKKIECQVLALDLRGHGSTEASVEDMSLEQLAQDVTELINEIYNNSPPPIVLVGHSLGGAVAVEVANKLETLIGLCVIDVVEGSALDALASMQMVLRGRPSGFKSIEQAIQWGLHGGSTHNNDAARISMPGQIKNIETGLLASEEVENGISPQSPVHNEVPVDPPQNSIAEEDEEDSVSAKPPLPHFAQPTAVPFREPNKYTWCIDLMKTEKFWTGWFKGLSEKFLNVYSPKILLLANISGLDTPLTVGQMQGKFQLQVLPRSGHAIHEDQPEHVANIIATYLVRQKLANAISGFVPILPGC